MNQESSQIEFANNGIVDSLTGSPAPSIFRSELFRASARSHRGGGEICIITFRTFRTVRASNSESKQRSKKSDAQKKILNSLDQIQTLKILEIAETLKNSIRGGDFFTRMSVSGFWLCFHGGKIEAMTAVARILENLNELNKRNLAAASNPSERAADFAQFEVKTAIHSSPKPMDLSAWIDEIDQSYFAVT